MISDRISNVLFRAGRFTVLERSQTGQILKEQGFQQSGCTSDQCAVEAGQLLGVQYMVVGSVGLIGRTYSISSRVIDVGSGKIVASAEADCKCEIDDVLTKSSKGLVADLLSAFSGAPSRRQEPVAEPKKPVVEKPARPATGVLRIATRPDGATLFLNDTTKASAPVTLDGLAPGTHRLRVELAGFRPLSKKVTLYAGDTVAKTYVLKPVPLPGSGREKVGGKKSSWPKNTFGIGSVVALGAGYLLDGAVKKEVNQCADIALAYRNSGSSAGYETYRQDYADHISKAQSNTLYRNVSYGLSAACLAGFAISFAF